jgi:hypothetical protein
MGCARPRAGGIGAGPAGSAVYFVITPQARRAPLFPAGSVL